MEDTGAIRRAARGGAQRDGAKATNPPSDSEESTPARRSRSAAKTRRNRPERGAWERPKRSAPRTREDRTGHGRGGRAMARGRRGERISARLPAAPCQPRTRPWLMLAAANLKLWTGPGTATAAGEVRGRARTGRAQLELAQLLQAAEARHAVRGMCSDPARGIGLDD